MLSNRTFDFDVRVALKVIVSWFPGTVIEAEHRISLPLSHLNPSYTFSVHKLCSIWKKNKLFVNKIEFHIFLTYLGANTPIPSNTMADTVKLL